MRSDLRGSCEVRDDPAQHETLPSYSTKDLSQLISSWVGKKNSREYENELGASSGSDFHKRVLNRRRSSADGADIAANAKEIQDEISNEMLEHYLTDRTKSGDKRLLEDSDDCSTKFPRFVENQISLYCVV